MVSHVRDEEFLLGFRCFHFGPDTATIPGFGWSNREGVMLNEATSNSPP